MKLTSEQLKQYDQILSRGLCSGQGDRDGQMCIEAAICTVLGLPHGDDPGCVSDAVRAYKICLNDSQWSSAAARAAGLRDLGLAQLGSRGVCHDARFSIRLTELTIRELLPSILRSLPTATPQTLAAAERCEVEGTQSAASAANAAAYAAYAAAYADRAARAAYAAADAAAYAANAARCAAYAATNASAYAANVAADAANAANAGGAGGGVGDRFLLQSAALALRVLRELGSPGIELLS